MSSEIPEETLKQWREDFECTYKTKDHEIGWIYFLAAKTSSYELEFYYRNEIGKILDILNIEVVDSGAYEDGHCSISELTDYEIKKLQQRILELEKFVESELDEPYENLVTKKDHHKFIADFEKTLREVYGKQITKRDELLRQAKLEMLSWCDRNRCDLDSIHEWLKQYEEMKR